MKRYITFFVLVTGLTAGVPEQSEVMHLLFAEGQPLERTLVKVSGDSWHPEDLQTGTPIPAPHIKLAHITLDGLDNEPEWASVEEVTIPLEYGNTKEATIKALHTDNDVYIRLRWADDSENRDHHPWMWNSEKESYITGPQIEDSALLSFEVGCEWSPSVLAGWQYDFDAWHWKAARSDPVGQAWDLMGTTAPKDRGERFVPYQSRIKPVKTWNIKFSDRMEKELSYANWDELDRWYRHQTGTPEIFLRMALDGTLRDSNIETATQQPAPLNPPENSSQTFPQFNPVKLEGNAGEIGAKGQWKNGYWTVEFRRALVTPAMNYSDVVFNRLVQFSVHIFDQVERVDQSSESGRLWLQFLPNDQSLPGEEEQLLVKK